MKRKAKVVRRHPVRPFDIKKEVPKARLAALGAALLAWNDTEAMLDVLLCTVACTPLPLWREFATRINGYQGKIALIRSSATALYGFTAHALKALNATIADFGNYRGLRDPLAHGRIVDKRLWIAEMAIRRDQPEEVLITAAALNRYYDHVVMLKLELQQLVGFFDLMQVLETADELGNIPRSRWAAYAARREEMASQGIPLVGFIWADEINRRLLEQEVQAAWDRYIQIQTRRKSIPPLPKFQAKHLNPDEMAEAHPTRSARRTKRRRRSSSAAKH